MTDPLLGQSGDIFEEVSDGRLDLGPEVVERLEQVDVGDVEGVAGVAADEDVRHMEQEQQRPGVLVPTTRPEGQEALVSQVVLGILSNCLLMIYSTGVDIIRTTTLHFSPIV